MMASAAEIDNDWCFDDIVEAHKVLDYIDAVNDYYREKNNKR